MSGRKHDFMGNKRTKCSLISGLPFVRCRIVASHPACTRCQVHFTCGGAPCNAFRSPLRSPFHPRHNTRNSSKHWSFSFSHTYPNHLKKSALHLLVEPGAIRHPLGMPSNHRALSPFRILRTSFRTSHLSTALCSFTLLLKVTI